MYNNKNAQRRIKPKVQIEKKLELGQYLLENYSKLYLLRIEKILQYDLSHKYENL